MVHATSKTPEFKRNRARQIALLAALHRSEQPLSSADLFARVADYAERFQGEGRDSGLEKLFERDREELRKLGIPLEVVPDPTSPDDRAKWRYRVAPAESKATVHLNAEETLLLDLASRVWLDPALAEDARRGYLKLLGFGDAGAAIAAMPSVVTVTHESFPALRDAITHGYAVSFEYANQSERPPLRRVVEPLRLLQESGRWLLQSWDVERDAERNFLLTRIVSEIRPLPDHPVRHAPSEDLRDRLRALAHAHPVEIAVEPDSDAHTRFSKRGEQVRLASVDDSNTAEAWPVLRIYDWDHGVLADELAASGTQVRVCAPADLAEKVRHRLNLAVRAHGGVDS